MYFKILPDTKLFDDLTEINKGMIAAKAAIIDTLKQMGFTGKYASSSGSYNLVSCDAIEIEGGKPEGWKVMGSKWQQLYWPLASNKKALQQLSALPSIKNEVINDRLKFSFSLGDNLEMYHRPGVQWHKKFILVETVSAKYKPVAGMIEILESEFNKLKSKIKDA